MSPKPIPSGRQRSLTKDPKGGLTAAGRRTYLEEHGSRLKPGVKKPVSRMTPDEIRRKASWSLRFYGRAGELPPLVGKNGKPTRFALTAAAWGEPVPRTPEAARRIAMRGRALMDRYNRMQERARK